MYKNLENVIYENHMSINSAASAIGMTDRTLRYKIDKETFDVSEAFKIRNLLFPKYDLYYLFESDENDTKSAWGGKNYERVKKMRAYSWTNSYCSNQAP